MQVPEPHRLEGMSLRRRIAAEDGGARHVALLQAYGKSVLEVDGGKQDHVTLTRSANGLQCSLGQRPGITEFHGFQLRKFAMNASPSFWLFSG